ncbi:S-adenosyl-L-methionine-dependent methyltransferase [Terfezia boudieri ATCC MYA-4762]|uniref:Protein-lysine N-methyltransferase EFM4 n=1 Tax=Terfezia boudieri ATCC MYA-4762 TaxID=1051890 RepID=A0A3N4LMJ4_9PEZI|nr:S-adenosyl-L-methionine-dependent methyltransferase [Terfezia boudieri ATCC MYA-4762]
MAEEGNIVEDLNPSKLGTKSYWDEVYDREKQNFSSNPEDEGIVWFEETNAENRVMRYLEDGLEIPEDSSFLDVGTGNGHLLFELRGTYTGGRMLGVDYSEKSIELAIDIAKERGLDGDVEFVCADVVREDPMKWAGEPFDVVLDKGTFDAISLSDEVLEDGRKPAEEYAEKIVQTVKLGKWFIITSCNWTEDELKRKFVGVRGLEYYGNVKYPSFTFGGKKGQAISSLCFRRSN